jgi:hypothetical protein
VTVDEARQLVEHAEHICATNDDWVQALLAAAQRAHRAGVADRGLVLFGVILGLASSQGLDTNELRAGLARAAAEHHA